MPIDWEQLRPSLDLTKAQESLVREIGELFLTRGVGTPGHQKKVELRKNRSLLDELVRFGFIRSNRNNYYPAFPALYYVSNSIRENYAEMLHVTFKAIQTLYENSGPQEFSIQVVEQEVNMRISAGGWNPQRGGEVYTYRAALFLQDFSRLVMVRESDNPDTPVGAVVATDNILDYEDLQKAWREELAVRPQPAIVPPAPSKEPGIPRLDRPRLKTEVGNVAVDPPTQDQLDDFESLLKRAKEADFETAEELLSKAVELAKERQDYNISIDAEAALADLLVKLGRENEAAAHYERALTHAKATRNELAEARVLLELGRLRDEWREFGSPKEAFRRVNEIAAKAPPGSMLWQYGQEAISRLGHLRVTAPEFEDTDANKERESWAGSREEALKAAATPRPESRLVSAAPTPKVVSDRWSEEDTLGYGTYARTLAGLIVHKETIPPLSIGIKAPWGAGKTSLMKQVQHILDGEANVTEENEAAARNKNLSITGMTISELWKKLGSEIPIQRPTPKLSALGELYGIPPRITVWFNAWKYQTSEQIWAGLAHCIISQVTARMNTHERESFWLKLHARRVNKEAVRRKLYELILRNLAPILVVGAICSVAAAWVINPFAQTIIPLLGIKLWWTKAILPLATVIYTLWKVRYKLGERAADAFKELVREPDYEGKMGFLHLVESDIRDVLNLVATRETPLVIFVDDLDRCTPRKVAEVVEAINLSLCGDYPNCIFVLGMEPGMVAAALEVANKDVIEKAKQLALLDSSVPLGWRFMEKIVQLPVDIPPPTEIGIRGYTGSLTGIARSIEREQEMDTAVPTPSLVKQEVDRWKEKLNVSKSVDEVVNLTDRLMMQATLQERRAVAEASKQKYAEEFTDRDPRVNKFLDEIVGLVGGNPRQIKRYINVFRFHSTLRHNLKVDSAAHGLEVALPSDEGLAKFIALIIQWPHALEFLRNSRSSRTDGKHGSNPISLLKLLEEKSRTISGQSDTAWIEFLKEENLDRIDWMATPTFRRFLAGGEPLSEIEGCGLW